MAYIDVNVFRFSRYTGTVAITIFEHEAMAGSDFVVPIAMGSYVHPVTTDVAWSRPGPPRDARLERVGGDHLGRSF